MISVRISDIRQFAFCPRVIWHRVVMGQPTRETPKMTMGRYTEQALARLERRRTLRRYGLECATRKFNVFLESEVLGLHGVCDLVLEAPQRVRSNVSWERARADGRGPDASLACPVYPVEIKTTRGGVGQHHVLQITAYAMLLEERCGATIDRGFVLVLPEDRIHVVRVGPDERAEVLRIAAAIREMLILQQFPRPTRYRSFCVDCEYVNFCGDVL